VLMRTRRLTEPIRRGNSGFTLIELLVAMAIGIVVSLSAFSFLGFATGDVSRINERIRVDQAGRIAMERIMLELRSACVSPSVAPIRAKSNESTIKFISEAGTASVLSEVHLREIIYTAASGGKKGTLVEKTYSRIQPPIGKTEPEYTFSSTASSTTRLLTGVKLTETGSETVPIFRYYRYYKAGDTLPTGDTSTPYYEINTKSPLSNATMEKEEEAKNVAKVSVSFTLAPEGTEPITFDHDRPIPLEDSVVFRLATSSESAHNLPCSPES
jgi:prepilin-type N-terminal cleavage/methylation domain-containing protein